MQLSYKSLINLLDSDATIQEVVISEGGNVFIGYLRDLETPQVLNGMTLTQGVDWQKSNIFGVVDKSLCEDVIKGFESSENTDLQPKNERPMVTHDGSGFRLLLVDAPLAERLSIFYRRYTQEGVMV